jgi:hypothetical protein
VAAKFHINAKGEPRPCTATVRACRYGSEDHFDSKETAVRAAEARLATEHGSVPAAKNKSTADHASNDTKAPENVAEVVETAESAPVDPAEDVARRFGRKVAEGMTFKDGPLRRENTSSVKMWANNRLKALEAKPQLEARITRLERLYPSERRDTAMVNINSKKRWKSLDREISNNVDLNEARTELERVEKRLKRSAAIYPHDVDFASVRPGQAALIDGVMGARIAKVNSKTITDEDGCKYSHERVWYVSSKA